MNFKREVLSSNSDRGGHFLTKLFPPIVMGSKPVLKDVFKTLTEIGVEGTIARGWNNE